MYTRKDYLNKKCTHREYYAQFVNKWQIDQVLNAFGLDRLLKSTDEHLNDLPLKEWDRLGVCGLMVNEMEKAGDFYTLAGAVCINKEAAKQIIESKRG